MDKIKGLEHDVEVRDEFIAVVSHEIRAPLGAIMLQTGRLGYLPPAQQMELGDKIRKNVVKIANLLTGLMDAIKTAKVGVALHAEEIDLVVVVRESVECLKLEAEKKSCLVTVTCPPQLMGYWDPMRVGQIVTNLLANALKYGAGQPIDITVEAIGDDAVIIVRDEGIGIPLEDRHKIFEKFERLSDSDGIIGFGLGLWLVKEIIHATHGSITVEPNKPKGSVFKVLIPGVKRA